MQQTFEITGMHCGGCVNRVTKALQTLGAEVSVTLDPPQAVVDAAVPLSVEQVKAAVAKAGDFQVRAL